ADFNSELLKMRSEVEGTNRVLDDTSDRTGRLGSTISTHLPAASKHVNDFSRVWFDAQHRLREAQESLTKGLEPAFESFGLKALTATASVGGLIEAVRGFAESSHAIENLSRHTGFATRDLEGLLGVSREVGMTTGSMSSAIEFWGANSNNSTAPIL